LPSLSKSPDRAKCHKNDKTYDQPDRGTLYPALEKGKLKSRKVKAESG
jgi:hypothetical protein